MGRWAEPRRDYIQRTTIQGGFVERGVRELLVRWTWGLEATSGQALGEVSVSSMGVRAEKDEWVTGR